MEQKYHQLFRDAFDNYLHHLDSSDLEPQGQLLPYDFEFLENRKWHGLAESLIKCDLRELTNLINRWNMSLCRWHAWNLVLQNRDEDSAWSLREEFLEALAHE